MIKMLLRSVRFGIDTYRRALARNCRN